MTYFVFSETQQVKKVLEEIQMFNKKIQTNMKKKREIKKLCSDIDEITAKLKTITKLEHCKELETSFSAEATTEEIYKRHNEQFKQINLKWWEKLDIYEENNDL